MALVSVGMPVLNGGRSIERALASLCAQSFGDLEIVVCDNASDDDTAARVAALAARDPRIRLRCFTERVDILRSFQRALEATTAPFVFFAPADDRWAPTFVEKNLAALQADPSLAASCCRIVFIEDQRIGHISQGTKALRGRHLDNLLGYLADPADNGRAFGIFRRAALQGAFPPAWYPAWDYQMLARTLAAGGHFEVPEVLLERDRTPTEKYNAEFDRHYRCGLLLWFPHLPAAWAIWRDRTTPKRPSVCWNLFCMVLRSHLSFVHLRSPRWARIAFYLARKVKFRRWAFRRGPVPPALP